jgi:hypothetical protein
MKKHQQALCFVGVPVVPRTDHRRPQVPDVRVAQLVSLSIRHQCYPDFVPERWCTVTVVDAKAAGIASTCRPRAASMLRTFMSVT